MRRAEDGRGSRSWTSPRPIRCRADELDEPMAVVGDGSIWELIGGAVVPVAREIWHRGGRGDRIIVISSWDCFNLFSHVCTTLRFAPDVIVGLFLRILFFFLFLPGSIFFFFEKYIKFFTINFTSA